MASYVIHKLNEKVKFVIGFFFLSFNLWIVTTFRAFQSPVASSETWEILTKDPPQFWYSIFFPFFCINHIIYYQAAIITVSLLGMDKFQSSDDTEWCCESRYLSHQLYLFLLFLYTFFIGHFSSPNYFLWFIKLYSIICCSGRSKSGTSFWGMYSLCILVYSEV